MNRAHNPADVDRRVRAAATDRCGYCLSPLGGGRHPNYWLDPHRLPMRCPYNQFRRNNQLLTTCVSTT